MINEIRKYVGQIFANVPASKNAMDLQEEISSNLIDKYIDLTGQGMEDQDAYTAAIASLGNVDEILETLTQPSLVDSDSDMKQIRRNATFISIAVSIFILSIIPISIAFMLENRQGIILSVSVMLACWAVAVGLLIYNNLTKPKSIIMGDTMVDEFKQWKHHNEKQSEKKFGAFAAALWTTTLAVYFILSFATGKWSITWMIFLVAIAVQQIVRAVMTYKGNL